MILIPSRASALIGPALIAFGIWLQVAYVAPPELPHVAVTIVAMLVVLNGAFQMVLGTALIAMDVSDRRRQSTPTRSRA